MGRQRDTSLAFRKTLQQREQSPSQAPTGHGGSRNPTPKGTPTRATRSTSKSTPNTTPKVPEWTVEKFKSELTTFAKELRQAHRNLCAYTIRSAVPIDSRVHQGKDWFAGLSTDNVPEEKDVTIKIKVRVGQGLAENVALRRGLLILAPDTTQDSASA